MFTPPESFNIADYFLDNRVREGRGERIALISGGRRWSYREVQAQANRFANALAALGVRPEERVLVSLPDGPEYVAALFGALKAGAVVVMVNPHLKSDDFATFLGYARARVAVVHAADLAAWAPPLGTSRHLAGALVAGDAPDGFASLEQALVRASEAFDNFPTHRDDPALWLFSGGTTGRPKGVVQSHLSFANTTELYAKRTLGYREDDVTLSVPKLFFGYATGSNLFFPFAVGATSVLFSERSTADEVFRQIRRHRPTILVNVPTMVGQMVSHPEAAAQDLSSLRFATSAGEALPAELCRRWTETFGVELLDGLGTAEMWHIFLTNRPGEVRAGTLGRVVDGFEIRVCDALGREVPDGEVGALWVRGRSRALGYWHDLAATAAAFRGEWYVSGDLVCRDAEGYVTYCGRADDMLKVSGQWVSPEEVESCLLAHPAVRECAVVGIPAQAGLTRTHAFVVAREARPGLEEEIRSFLGGRLAPYKVPRAVTLLAELPRTHLGKVDRGRLRSLG
jgi:benzoate-CoA ligase family protein